MKVRTIDVLKYANYQIDRFKNKKQAMEAKYEAAKVVYESQFLNKLFGWKYENSTAGDRSWFTGSWYMHDNTEYFTDLIAKGEYHILLGDELFELPIRSESAFYEYAKDNGLPH
jgi:hypothetical protein